jgi:hypothetical protein
MAACASHVPVEFAEVTAVPVAERTDGYAAVRRALGWSAIGDLAVSQNGPAAATERLQHGFGVALGRAWSSHHVPACVVRICIVRVSRRRSEALGPSLARRSADYRFLLRPSSKGHLSARAGTMRSGISAQLRPSAQAPTVVVRTGFGLCCGDVGAPQPSALAGAARTTCLRRSSIYAGMAYDPPAPPTLPATDSTVEGRSHSGVTNELGRRPEGVERLAA